MDYKFTEHTADVEFKAYGKTLEKIFENSLRAQFDTIADIKAVEKSKKKDKKFTIKESATALEELLWFVLQDALSISDSEGLYCYGVEKISGFEVGPPAIGQPGNYEIEIIIKAKEMDPKFSKLNVKGVSKFNLKILKKKEGFESSAVLDV